MASTAVQQDLLPSGPATVAVLLSVFLSMVVLLCYYSDVSFAGRRRRRGRGPTANLPPSPRKLPFVGNLHQLGGLPHRSLLALSRQHGPLMLLQLGQVPTLVVSSADLAEEVMKSQDLAFASRPRSRVFHRLTGGKTIGFAPYGEYWRQARKACVVHLLSPHRVQGFRPAREEEVARLVERISELSSSAGGAIDVGSVLSSFANSVICRAVLGAPAVGDGKTGGEIAELVTRTLKVIEGLHVDNFFPSLGWLDKITGMDAKVARLARRWRGVLYRLMEEEEKAAGGREGRAEGVGTFLDALLSLRMDANATAGFVPSTDGIRTMLQGMIIAASVTTFRVLEAALAELVKNPSAMEKAQGEVRGAVVRGKPMVAEEDLIRMGYLNAVIKETLRLHPPAPLLVPRESMKSVQIRGYDIPNKTRVFINAWAIARDPDCWESPEEFLPERFLKSSVDFRGNHFQFIPFGAGRRICPGMHFAKATVDLALANLLYHFDWGPDEAASRTFREKRSLHLVPKRNSSPHV